MWAIEPLVVSCTVGPSTACGEKRRIMSMDAFFRLTGRARGTMLPDSASIRVSSSDSRRQPRCDKAGAQGTLARPRRRGKDNRAPLFLDDGGVDDQILVGVGRHAPVQSPFEHGKCLLGRQGIERQFAVEIEQRLWPQPSPDVGWWTNSHMEIRELLRLRETVIGVMECDAFADAGQRRLDQRDDRSGAQPDAGTGQSTREFDGG